MGYYFVRIGLLGDIFVAQSNVAVSHPVHDCVHDAALGCVLDRGDRVLCRTDRGVELGSILASCSGTQTGAPVQILRKTTAQDELLLKQLERHKRDAVEACRNALAESGSPAILLDVDQIFDGGTLIMHLLGNVDSLAQQIIRDVTRVYESIAPAEHFAKLLSDCCGSSCGGENGGGCGTSRGCGGCGGAAACPVPWDDKS